MCMLKTSSLFAIVPMTLILTVSFFVLFALRKIETGALRVFGYSLAVLLWIIAAMVFVVGYDAQGLQRLSVSQMMTGCPMTQMMQRGMQGSGRMPHQMMQGQMPGQVQEGGMPRRIQPEAMPTQEEQGKP